MRCAWLIVILLLCSSFGASGIAVSENTGMHSYAEKQQWVEVDRISKTIEIDPLSSYYFQVKNLTLLENRIDKLPVSSALKRVPNWLRDDLERNLKQLANATVDVGDYAAPALFDFDEDGDLDIIVGTADGYMYIYERKNNFWTKAGTLSDSAGNPIYAGSQAVPYFEDIDGDGDLDLVVGTWDGKIKWYENTTLGWVHKGYLADNNQNEINVGEYSAPVFGKVYMHSGDPDGLDWDDLTIGAEDGNIYCYENTGNGTSPIWTKRDNVYQTVNIYLQALEHPAAYSKPALADLDGDGDFDLTIGVDSGKLYYFERGGTATSPSWTYVSDMYANFEGCAYPAPHFGDLDRNKLLSQDCVFDLVVGRGDGHVHIFENLGTATIPRWNVWPNWPDAIESVHHMNYQDLTRLDKYLNLICDVEDKYVDEIAFCIAHTSPDVLANENVYPDVFVKNAELIYEIDKYILYANLVEEGNYTTGDYWTTVEYNVSAGVGGVITKYELPRDIYYWYIVHPKITDEIPTFINPDNGDADGSGYFWREYLFFHADDAYPDDPDTDPNNDGISDYYYPKDEPPPLLKDKIANITLLYDCVSYSKSQGYNSTTGYYDYDNPRTWNWSYAHHPTGIEIVSNWVKRTLPLSEADSGDGERPIQPVRIAHHHNGNCGELQDLTVAAARACLIPAAGVCLIGEDHVWAEFYERGWHQWDNQWGSRGGGSVINKFDTYWVDWGERGGSGIFRWNGDDSIDDRTADYVPTAATVTVEVRDANNNSVDGARVLVSSYWYVDNQIESITGMSTDFIHYVPNIAFPSIWDYTDCNGICEFRLVGSFQITIASKLGSNTSDDVEFGEGEDPDPLIFNLQDTSPSPYPKAEPGVLSGEYLVDVTYNILEGEQIQPPSPVVEDMHFEKVSAHTDLFTCTKNEMENFMCGETFDYIAFQPNQTAGTLFDSMLPDEGYIVFSNDDSIETKKIINVTIILKQQQNWAPTVTINTIPMPSSGLVTVSGTASSPSTANIIKSVWVKVDDSAWSLANGTTSWNYMLNITNYYLGSHTIYVRAIDAGDYYGAANITWLFRNQLVDISIVKPLENEIVSGASVPVCGIAVDYDGTVGLIEIRLANETWREVTKELDSNNWTSTIDTMIVNDGIQKIDIKAFDGILYSIKSVSVVVDNTDPAISVSSPKNNEPISGIVTVSGAASDTNKIKNISVRIDTGNGTEVSIVPAEFLYWSYELDTTALSEGLHTIYAIAYDGVPVHNETATVTIIVDNNKPPEILYSPTGNSVTIYENSTQEFKILDICDMEGQNVSIIWKIDGENITSAYNKYSYNFSANYSSGGIVQKDYEIKVEVWDSFWSKEAATQIWTLTVVNVNRIPKINYYSPEIKELTINELENILFYVNASDPDGGSLSTEWKVNDISKSTGVSYTFSTNYLSAGVYTIAVRVSDGQDVVEQIWRVVVLDVNMPPSAGFCPEQKEQTVKKNSEKLFSVENISDSENDELTIIWYVNGMAFSEVCVHTGDHSDYTYQFTSSGRHIISVSVSDGKTAISNTWIFDVEQPAVERPIPGFEMQIFLIALSIAIIILLTKRKKRIKL